MKIPGLQETIEHLLAARGANAQETLNKIQDCNYEREMGRGARLTLEYDPKQGLERITLTGLTWNDETFGCEQEEIEQLPLEIYPKVDLADE